MVIAEIENQYDVYFIDLWGVIHDGTQLYDGAKECLLNLKKLNKKIIFISNAPRMPITVANSLNRMGITQDYYDNIVTSGLIAHNYFSKKKLKSYHIGKSFCNHLLKETNTIKVDNIKDADIIINIGFDAPDIEIDYYKKLLQETNLDMYCLNPDEYIVKMNGTKEPCAGLIAKLYSQMNKKVYYFGKPYIDIYNYAYNIVNNMVKKNKILAIGDNYETDIRGANQFGIDVCWITGGYSKTNNNPEKYSIKYQSQKLSWN